ncbi:hypothetical protein B0H21DRAFT_877046 [Amylocystis lapponica]|nr:hypothetical protein B0H21DRAFT_877046 [Amylocystis lapponica]
MAESPSLPAATVVLRKRKRPTETLVLHLASSPSPSYDPLGTESEYEPDPASQAGPSTAGADNSTNTSRTPNGQYECTYEGCSKAYTKPSRLAEHQRSHTGDRPYVCATCNKSYLRETHLQAHARSHLPETAKPLSCDEPGCNKRFWTAQHLRVHEKIHKGEKPFICSEPSCNASFAKHHLLREHVCTVHSPPGTKPYLCGHIGCTKSFSTNQKLRVHSKTHIDKRYTCVHSTCVPATGAPAYYRHGRTFNAQSGLRAHLKLHVERDAEAELEMIAGGSTDENEDEQKPRKRRRGCDKDFKSYVEKALTIHTNVVHHGRRDFICPHADCQHAFGYKHLLQRHLAKSSDSADVTESETQHKAQSPIPFSIGLITGSAYVSNAQARIHSAKTLTCPYPSLPQLLSDHSTPVPSASCQYVFSRAYDLRRHLRSEHGIAVDKDSVDDWVKGAKKAKAGMSISN